MGARRIGILTGGGDCPGLNAVIRAVVKHATVDHGFEVIGIEDGFRGLYEKRFRKLGREDVRGLLVRGGTILGSSNRCDPFKYPVRVGPRKEELRDVSAEVLDQLAHLELEALVVVGGDGTMGMAHKLIERGARIVGVPKTIDNDLDATDLSFGHATAVEIATDAIDRLHTTAESHDRVVICEVMGRYSGWIALAAGIAGGADVILLPEIPYEIERVAEAVRRRSSALVCVAEGARPRGGAMTVQGGEWLGQEKRLGGVAQRLAGELAGHVEHELRVSVLGHVVRGGTPCAFDRLLATRFGAAAVDLVVRGELSRMVCLRGERIDSVAIRDAVGQPKLVDPQGNLVRTARATGVEMGA